MKKFLSLVAVVVVATVMSVATVTAQGNDPVAVINAYIAAENARNVDAALALFAQDAVISESPDPNFALNHSGEQEIRAYLQRLVDGFVTVEKVTGPALVGDQVEWTEIISESALVETRRVQAQVQDGKIKSLKVIEILRASGRTVPWTGGSGWVEFPLIQVLIGLGLLVLGVIVLQRQARKGVN